MDKIEVLKKEIERLNSVLEPIQKEYDEKYQVWNKVSKAKGEIELKINQFRNKIFKLENEAKKENSDNSLIEAVVKIRDIIESKYTNSKYIYFEGSNFDEFTKDQILFAIAKLVDDNFLKEKYFYYCCKCQEMVIDIEDVNKYGYFEIGSCDNECDEGFFIQKSYVRIK